MYPPHLAPESGIGYFFSYWGGESLYFSHYENETTNDILQKIGTPCIIEAKLPLNGMHGTTMALIFVKEYMSFHQLTGNASDNYETELLIDLAASDVIEIVEFPDKKFVDLSGCQKWDRSLISGKS